MYWNGKNNYFVFIYLLKCIVRLVVGLINQLMALNVYSWIETWISPVKTTFIAKKKKKKEDE